MVKKNKYLVKLDLFEGPLDLLWNLIYRSKLDIAEISLSQITDDFIKYLSMLKVLDIGTASDFILMASTLLHYKSKILLPVENEITDEPLISLPPELVSQLLEYKKYQQAALKLNDIEKISGEIFTRNIDQFTFDFADDDNWKEIDFLDLISAFSRFTKELDSADSRDLDLAEVSVEECITMIRERLAGEKNFLFTDIFPQMPNKIKLVATFLAILEMVRLKEIILKQHAIFGDIRIFMRNFNQTTGRCEC